MTSHCYFIIPGKNECQRSPGRGGEGLGVLCGATGLPGMVEVASGLINGSSAAVVGLAGGQPAPESPLALRMLSIDACALKPRTSRKLVSSRRKVMIASI